MISRLPEIIGLAVSVSAVILSLFVVPRLERSEGRKKPETTRWAIIDREFVEFGEECNG